MIVAEISNTKNSIVETFQFCLLTLQYYKWSKNKVIRLALFKFPCSQKDWIILSHEFSSLTGLGCKTPCSIVHACSFSTAHVPGAYELQKVISMGLSDTSMEKTSKPIRMGSNRSFLKLKVWFYTNNLVCNP